MPDICRICQVHDLKRNHLSALHQQNNQLFKPVDQFRLTNQHIFLAETCPCKPSQTHWNKSTFFKNILPLVFSFLTVIVILDQLVKKNMNWFLFPSWSLAILYNVMQTKLSCIILSVVVLKTTVCFTLKCQSLKPADGDLAYIHPDTTSWVQIWTQKSLHITVPPTSCTVYTNRCLLYGYALWGVLGQCLSTPGTTDPSSPFPLPPSLSILTHLAIWLWPTPACIRPLSLSPSLSDHGRET